MPWFYGPCGNKAIFSPGDTAIPEGWTETPLVHPLDHDGDGRKGGSRRGRRRRRGILSLNPRIEGGSRGNIG